MFCGLKGWSSPWEEAGHEVVTLDLDPRFDPTMARDVLTVTADEVRQHFGGHDPDVVLASPPCETFSVASMGHHWTGGRRAYVPRTPEAARGKEIVASTVRLVSELRPSFAVIENPRGVLRKLGIIPVEPVTVWYCHYGESRAKPTDLWGIPFPPSFRPEPACHNRHRSHPSDCCCHDHESAPRGARTGTQGIATYADRSVIPRALATAVMSAATSDHRSPVPS
jgi:hypothetical protein